MSRSNTSKRRKVREINPAMRIRDFYSFSLQILNEINYAREHPDEFVEKLKELREAVEDSKDNCLYIENVPFVYSNLLGSLDDSIKFLERQKEFPRLIYSKGITQACDYLLDELVAHDGLDDEKAKMYSLENRLKTFGRPLGESYELIDYGMFDPEFIVINFVLGDGDKNKFERNVIFNPKVKYIGIASGILSSDKICTIINCCEEFFETYEKVPTDIERKYRRITPSFNTKTINNYSGKSGNSTNVERYTSNTKKEGNVEQQFTEEINTKRGDSGDVFSVKKTEYIKRRESIKDPYKDKNKDARIPLRKKKTKNEPKLPFDIFDEDDDFDEDDFFDKEFDINFDEHFENKKNNNKSSKKTTTTTTTTDENGVKKTVVTTVTEEFDGKGKNRKYFDEEEENSDDDIDNNYKKSRKNKAKEREREEREERELNQRRKKEKERQKRKSEEEEEYEQEEDIEERAEKKRREKEKNERRRQKEMERQREYEKEKEKEREKEENNNKYKKKVVEIQIKLKQKKEDKEVYDDDTYKTVKEYPSHKKGYYEKEFEKEEEELENEYPTDYRDKKRRKYKIDEDMYEKEEDMELPEGAKNMQVKQKTITDSKGVPALIIKKTITYEDGSVKTIIEKKPINK